MNCPLKSQRLTSQDLDSAQRFYTRISHVYDAVADAGEHAARERGLELLNARTAERILEIGFGTGSAVVAIARQVGPCGRVVGVDISEGMREVATRRVAVAALSTSVDLRIAAVPPIPMVDREFDAAFMAFTLELFPDDSIPEVLWEIRRVLRPGGRVAIVAMDEDECDTTQRSGLAARTYRWLHSHFPHIIDCRPINAVRFLGEAGFTVTRAETFEIWGLPVKACLALRNEDERG